MLFRSIRSWARKEGYVKPKQQDKQKYMEIDESKLTQEQYIQYLKGQLTKEDLIKIMEEKNV